MGKQTNKQAAATVGPEWVSIPEAVIRSGVSRASLFRYLKRGQVESQRVAEGNKIATLVNLDSLERFLLASEERRPEIVESASLELVPMAAGGTSQAAAAAGPGGVDLPGFLALASILQAQSSGGPLYVDLKTAALITGLPKSHLRVLAKSGRVRGRQVGRRFLFHRASLSLI